MLANLENSAVATPLEKVSFHSSPKERHSQRMFKLLQNCTHLTCQQNNAQNSPSQALIVHELRTSRCSSWTQKKRGSRDQIENICWIIESARELNTHTHTQNYFCFIYYAKAFDCVDNNKLWKILQEMGIPDHFTCFLRNLYAGQE